MQNQGDRDVRSIRMPQWGRVIAYEGIVPWLLVDNDGAVVEPVRHFLMDFIAQDNSPSSVRSYAYALLRWWRWLRILDVPWQRATPAEVRDLVLWLKHARKPRPAPRTASARTAGTINPITRKRHLSDGYEPSTVRHSNAVIRSFYEHRINIVGDGPLINPVQLDRDRRSGTRDNPLDPARAVGRVRYNPTLPHRRPREMPEAAWRDVFGQLRSNRDRALLSMDVSCAARATELLGACGVDLDWGDQLVRVIRKGTRAQQWLPASQESFVWLRLYLADLAGCGLSLGPHDLLWWTLRRRDRGAGLQRQPMNYEALRALWRRINAVLGTNWSMHDLRHTAALRMARDESLSLTDVQFILGHAHLSTTADIYLVEDQAQVVRRVRRHLIDREHQVLLPPPPVAVGYDSADLAVLLGGLVG